MDNFWSSLKQAFGHLGTIRVMDIIDILIVALFFYFLITLVRRTKTNKLFQGIVYILLALWLSGEMQLYTVNYILRNAVQVGLLALVVLFQPEIRRFLEKLGTGSIFSRLLGAPHTLNADAAITQTVLACVDMSATRTGALIIFERDNRLDDQIRTGTILDAETTAELLKNIFYPKAPLHDGAVVVSDLRMQAAGCILPLSAKFDISKDLGTRHRAALGVTENHDCCCVVVSEETGAISFAKGGMLKRHLAPETLERLLQQELMPSNNEQGAGNFRNWLKGVLNK